MINTAEMSTIKCFKLMLVAKGQTILTVDTNDKINEGLGFTTPQSAIDTILANSSEPHHDDVIKVLQYLKVH